MFKVKNLLTSKIAFSLAEVLLTLAIIGIIATLTVPSVINNWQEQSFDKLANKTKISIENALTNYIASSKEGKVNLKDAGLVNKTEMKNFFENFLIVKEFCASASEPCIPEQYLAGESVQKEVRTDIDSSSNVTYFYYNAIYTDVRTSHDYPKEDDDFICATLKDNVVVCMHHYNENKEEVETKTPTKEVITFNPSDYPGILPSDLKTSVTSYYFTTDKKDVELGYGTIFIDINGTEEPNFLGSDVHIYYFDKNGNISLTKPELVTENVELIGGTPTTTLTCNENRKIICENLGGALGEAPYCQCSIGEGLCNMNGSAVGVKLGSYCANIISDYDCATTGASGSSTTNCWEAAKTACSSSGGGGLPTEAQWNAVKAYLPDGEYWLIDTPAENEAYYGYINDTVRTHYTSNDLGTDKFKALCIK